MKGNKILFFVLLFLIICIGIFIFLLQFPSPSSAPGIITPTQSEKTPSLQKTKAGKLIVNGVETNDFIADAKRIDSAGDVFFIDNPNYQILYMGAFHKFLISIVASPFEELRIKAEKEFMSSLGITEEQACKLNVEISTPYFANPKESGQTYSLSFCTK